MFLQHVGTAAPSDSFFRGRFSRPREITFETDDPPTLSAEVADVIAALFCIGVTLLAVLVVIAFQ